MIMCVHQQVNWYVKSIKGKGIDRGTTGLLDNYLAAHLVDSAGGGGGRTIRRL